MQGSLRPAQNFYLLYVKKSRSASQAAKINAINKQAHRRVQRVDKLTALTYTAYLIKPRAGASSSQIYVWRKLQQIFQVNGSALLNL